MDRKSAVKTALFFCPHVLNGIRWKVILWMAHCNAHGLAGVLPLGLMGFKGEALPDSPSGAVQRGSQDSIRVRASAKARTLML